MIRTLFETILVVVGCLIVGWLITNITKVVTFYDMETMSSPIGDKGIMIVFLLIGTVIVSIVKRK